MLSSSLRINLERLINIVIQLGNGPEHSRFFVNLKCFAAKTKITDWDPIIVILISLLNNFLRKRAIFQTFWKPDCCPKSLFFELETSNFGPNKMSFINVVQSCWNFAQFSKKKASSQNLRSLTQKTKIWCNNHFSRRFGRYCKVASGRPVYYSILELFDQRSQYISIKFPLHKPSENLKMCY